MCKFIFQRWSSFIIHIFFLKMCVLIVVIHINNLFKMSSGSWPPWSLRVLHLPLISSHSSCTGMMEKGIWKFPVSLFLTHFEQYCKLNFYQNLNFTGQRIWKYAFLFCQLWISLHLCKCDILNKVFHICWAPGQFTSFTAVTVLASFWHNYATMLMSGI